MRLHEVSPPGWEGTIKAMKKKGKVTNPWALAWWMKKQGYKPGYTETGKKKRKGKRESLNFDVYAIRDLVSYLIGD